MDALPQLGQGVRVAWGLSSVEGEVIDLVPPRHVVVRIPVRGASGEQIDSNTVRMPIDALEALPRWRVVRTRRGTPSAGADATKAWWVATRRNGDEATVEVRVSDSLAASTSLRVPEESRRAVETRGRSAVEKFAYRYRTPHVVVVGTKGVFELAS
jgi:hypothetical protein